jgi:hypothetical protein
VFAPKFFIRCRAFHRPLHFSMLRIIL